MARQKIIWTVLPNGRRGNCGEPGGRWRVSIVVSPRLTPQSTAEQRLKAFAEWLDWPATLARMKFGLEIGGGSVGLVPIAAPGAEPDSALWRRLFDPSLPVAGYEFKDMSAVNLRSYPVRNVLGFIRRHYRDLSAQAGHEHPTLLPWSAADPALKDMLADAGTRTQMVAVRDRRFEFLVPGFDRFHDEDPENGNQQSREAQINQSVFNGKSCVKVPMRRPGERGQVGEFPLRALPPDWEDPALLRSGAIPVSDPADRDARAELMEQFSGPGEYALWQSERFYRRTVPTPKQRAMGRPPYVGGSTPVKLPEFDFHQRVASYGDHPQLLRRLGLIIDCVLEADAPIDALLASATPATGFMRLRLDSKPPHDSSADAFPATAWQASKRRFVALPYTTDHAAGLLRLERANDRYAPFDQHKGSLFDVAQVDPDGAALKTVNFVLSAQRLVGKSLELGADGKVTYTTGDKQPVAALRSGGLGVSRHGRAGHVATMAAAAKLNNDSIESGGAAAARVVLFAEDVLRGYRIDVNDMDVGRWHSLCQRVAQCTAVPREAGDTALQIPMSPDEGYVKGASTTGNADQPDDHYLHETLFRWTGWSLAAPRPGRAIKDRTEPGTELQTEEVVDVAEQAPSGNGIAVKVSAQKGSLPRLRFGHRYRVRARIVDLAGNSLALDDPDLVDDEQASDPVGYGRFEPVDPPALVLTRKLSEGESLERLVLRSNFDRGTDGYTDDIAGSATLAPLYANPDFEYGVTSERHVVPPKAAVQQCELHGAFDVAVGQGDPMVTKAAYAIAARESGSLMRPVPGAQIELVTPAAAAAVATVQGPGALIEPPDQADATRDRFAAGQYLVHREALVPVPYLPDPASGGVALHGVPGIEKLVAGLPVQLLAPGLFGVVVGDGLRAALMTTQQWILLVDFDADPGDDPANDWPDDIHALRIVLAEQPGEVDTPPCGAEHTPPDAPQWSLAERRLTIFLPKGHIAHLRYASFVHDRLIGHFGLSGWHDGSGAATLRAEAMAGANWMMTPWRGVTLVHATQQPVCLPKLDYAHATREPGGQYAIVHARQVLLHGPSTGKFEILGEWDEWIDDPLSDDPSAPGPRRVHHQAQLAEIRLADNHANAFVLQQAIEEQRSFQPVGGQVTAGTIADRPAVPGNRHEFGDTRFRMLRYHLRATTRFREYLPPKLFADASLITREGPVVESDRVEIRALPGLGAAEDPGAPVIRVNSAGMTGLIVPSSAPPAAPELIYVVPTFRWDRPARSGNTLRSTRIGNGLRVYLDRPWFSSGDGELLGVVIAGDNARFNAITPEQLPFVTQWGRDPIWDSTNPTVRSRVGDFPAAVTSEPVNLLETGTAAHVVGHRVHFDAGRKLWYCDIELNPGMTYMPFVRLALVRYQPNSLEGASISKVVLAEFAQVLPRRFAELQHAGAALHLRLHGPAPQRGPMRQFNAGGTAESPYADVSFAPGIGQNFEQGRNRIELVLQTRDPKIDSDLAWSDHSVLGSGLVGDVAPATPEPEPVRPRVDRSVIVKTIDPTTTVPVRTRLGRTLRFDRAVQTGQRSIGSTAAQSVAKESIRRGLAPSPIDPQIWRGPPPFLLDPPIWNLSATLPKLPTDRPARLMLREFERFYTDKTVPETRAGRTHRRVVVEERLVYAELFDLA